MTMPLPPFVLTGTLLVALAGCASAPPTRFHSLLAGTSAAAAPAPTLYIDLAPVGLPASVDQPQWVVRLQDDSLRVLEQERWVAPLRDEVRAALLEGLRLRSGVANARTAAAPTGEVSRVRVDVLRFESMAGHGTWLEARWTVAPGDIACGVSLREAADGEPLVLARAHRHAVNTLADHIGASLTTRKCPA